jgi:hypothetical protein
MKFAVRDKTMFQTVFSPSREEARTLLESVRYLWEEEAGTRIVAYLRFMARTLKPGGTLLSVNLRNIALSGGECVEPLRLLPVP